MLSWSDEGLVLRMREGWSGGLYDGTPCGGGSTKSSAASVARELPDLVRRLGIKTVCDAGAGDLHWIAGVQWNVSYRAFDLVPRHRLVEPLDIAAEALPVCDAILCRHVLIHFDPPRILSAIDLFRKSGRYLLASQYDNAPPFDGGNQYNPTDLRPLLGEPIERIPDAGSDLAVWRL